MKKSFLIVGAIALFVTLGIIVACNKEFSPKNDEIVATKSYTNTQQQLTAAVNVFWQYCRDAYRNHPNDFISICNSNSLSNFFSITNMPPALFDTIAVLSNRSLKEYIQENPDSTLVGDSCHTCIQTLADLGYRVAQMCDDIEVILALDKSFDDDYPCTVTPKEGCKYNCSLRTCNNVQYTICVTLCFMDLNSISIQEYREYLEAIAQPGFPNFPK